MLITNTLNFMDKNALSNSVNFGLEDDMVSSKHPRKVSLLTGSTSIPRSTAGPAGPCSTWVSLVGCGVVAGRSC